jgi:hypothetical protein
MLDAGLSFDPIVLLDAMLEDMARQDALHQPTAFWADASRHITEELRTEGFSQFRRLAGPRSFFVPSYGPPGNTLSEAVVAELEAVVLRHADAGSKPQSEPPSMSWPRSWDQDAAAGCTKRCASAQPWCIP